MSGTESMQEFDVVVVGGGPAGGQCARSLAKAGRKVLLVERHQNFEVNSFSSAGTPIATLSTYELPESVVGSYWHQFVVVTSNKTGHWQAEKPLGAVLDFGKLRQFLADEVRQQGGAVWMGCRYVSHQQQDGQTQVKLMQDKTAIVVNAKVLVDATGPFRAVIQAESATKQEYLVGTGIEYLIEVDQVTYQRCANALTFFLGYRWMPKGYSWIFPMEPNRLKVGAALIKADHQFVHKMEPLKHYIHLILDDYLHTTNYNLIEVHGATLKYSSGLQDVYYEGNTIAIGDAVSTVNALGGEGVRHGMQGADIASRYIQQYLDGKISTFQPYQTEMHQVFLKTWNLSEQLCRKRYLQDRDEILDKMVTYLQPLSLEDIVDILFYYRFDRISKGLPQYLLRKLDSFWTRLLARFKFLRNSKKRH
ncbi:MAG: NAD(P)/FAD-dependent oxidoreductase [Leptolyngbyaceae cyanobacterium bins.302]|nr:NAD(P)/FAD-dependent oxidoreductase [Leptolyngbyaceae cyanobacterium bins.302]